MENRNIHNNPYWQAIFTATLSGMFAVIGIYITSDLSQTRTLEESAYKIRSEAYLKFLTKINSEKNNLISKIHFAGKIAENAHSDSEVQDMEDYFYTLSSQLTRDGAEKLNQEFSIIKATGSKEVRKIINDMFSTITLQDRKIDIYHYSIGFQSKYITWSPYKKAIKSTDVSKSLRKLLEWSQSIPESDVAYFEVKISDDERFMIILISILYDELLDQINSELNNER